MELADGAWYFLIFLIIAFAGIVIGYFTEKGSGIIARPYEKLYSGSPGAKGPGNVSGHDDRVVMRDWSRGCR